MKYNIKAGDTLSKIAKEFNTTVDNLLNSNQSITDPNQISAGQSIEVPGGSYAAAISSGISSLQTGKAWGDVWNAIKKDYGNVANEQIDKDLGVQWREAGAYESYIAQQQGHLPVIKDATPEQIKERIATPEELLEMKAYRQSLKLTPEEEVLVPEFDTSYQKPIQKPTEERPKPEEGLRSFFNKFIPESFRAKINKIIDAPEKISQASSFKDVVAETKSVIKEVTSPVMQWLNPAVKTITSGFLNKIEDVSQRTLKQRSIESKDKYENGIIDEEDIFDDRYPDKIQAIINANNLLGTIEGQAEDHYKLTVVLDDDILKPVMIPDTDKIFNVGELHGNIIAKDDTSYALNQKKYHNLENVSIDKLKESVNKLKELGFNIPDNEYGMPNLENAGSELEKNRDEFEKILIEKYNLGPTSAMITYNKMTEERKVSINTITSILDKDLSKLTSFDYSDAPDEINQIINDALNSLAADTSTIRQLDKGLKTLNDYNDIYNTNELEYNKAEEQQKELDKKIIKLMSDEIEKWMLAHREIDIMDESKIEKHFEFYNDNKVAIDNLFRLTQEYQDIAEYMNIKAASANRAKERADELDTTTGLSIDKLKPIILDPDFISILSKYAVKAIPGTSDLVEAMKQLSDADEWLVANDSKVKMK